MSQLELSYTAPNMAPLAGPRTRATDPSTSHEATKVITRKGVAKTQEAILRHLRREPLIAEDLENLVTRELNIKPQRVRTELKNLSDDKRIRVCGHAKTSSGVFARKWEAVS